MDSQKSTDHLYVAEILNNFLKSEGLGTSQYKQFWQTLTATDATTTTYLVVLLTKLLVVELNEDKQPTQLLDYVQKILRNEQINIPSNGTAQLEEDAAALKQSVLNTIYFVTLFYTFENEDNNLKNVISKVQQVVSSDKKIVADSFIDEIVKMLLVSLESNDRTISLIDQCSNIELSSFDWGQSIDKSEAKYGSLSYIDIYLRNTLREGTKANRCKLIFETILLFLKHPLLSEKRMLSLLHMLKNYIIKSPKVSPEILSSALAIVRPYYLWPRPHSDFARDVLQMLTIELKSPGAAFRKVLAEECPELAKGVTKTGKERYVYLLVDESSANARKLREMIKSTTNSTDINISVIQLNLLSNILSSALLVEHDSLGLESLPREEVAKYYEAAVQILSEAVLMNQEDAEGYRIKELTALKTEIDNTLSTITANNDLKPKHPSLPSLSFQVHSMNFDNSTKTSSFIGNLKYPKRSCMDNLSNILEQYAPFADPKNKPIVKIGIVGGDGALHNFVNSYVCLRSSNQKLFEGIELQVFMVPSEPNDFCIFLSKYDGWFARQIYLAMYCIFKLLPGIVPSPPVTVSKEGPLSNSGTELNKPKGLWGANDAALQEQLKATLSNRTVINVNPLATSRSKSESSLFQDLKVLYDQDEKISNPSQILRSTLENYFREAKVKLDMCLYQCECWSENSYFSVPFCQRVELGIKPFTRAFQRSNELPENMSMTAIQQHKSFKYSPPGYTIKYTQMNLVGAVKQAPPMESRPYQSIVIANVPYHGDKGVTPNPTKPYLEMLTIESDSKKRKGKGKDSDDASCYHVSLVDIECEDKKKMFHILLDNVLYGPFCRIRVTPSNVSQEEILTLPVMSFFPLDL